MALPPTELYQYVGSNVVATFRRLRAEGLLLESAIERRDEVLEEWLAERERISAEVEQRPEGVMGPNHKDLWVAVVDRYLNARGHEMNRTFVGLPGQTQESPPRPGVFLRWWYRHFG